MKRTWLRRRAPRRIVVLLATVMALVAMSASPASAATGAGTHEGHFDIGRHEDAVFVGPVLLCHQSDLDYDTIVGAGAFEGSDETLPVGDQVYAGPMDVEFTVNDVWQHFQGTVPGGSVAGCLPANIQRQPPTPVMYPVQGWSIDDTIEPQLPGQPDLPPLPGGTQLQCSGNEGQYGRIGTVHYANLSGKCKVGTGGFTDTTVRMVGDTVAVVPTTDPLPPPLDQVPEGSYVAWTLVAEDSPVVPSQP